MNPAPDRIRNAGWRTRRWALWVLGLLASGAVWAQTLSSSSRNPPSERGYPARVTRVSDGDTLWVRPLEGGRPRKLRVEGIDAPEICQDGGAAARDALAQRVLNQVVQVQQQRRDDYGRGLARLQHGGEDVGAWLVSNGLAWSYRWRHSTGPYAEEEARARAQRKGLFAQTSPESPRQFRQRHGPCETRASG